MRAVLNVSLFGKFQSVIFILLKNELPHHKRRGIKFMSS